MGARRIRREQRREDMAESRRRNGALKVKERARRDARMTEVLKKGQPYNRLVLSWLSTKIDKPGRLITPDDVQKYLQSVKQAPATTGKERRKATKPSRSTTKEPRTK